MKKPVNFDRLFLILVQSGVGKKIEDYPMMK